MAKKNLHTLMSGIIGSDNNDSTHSNTPDAEAPVDAIAKPVKAGPGRPKKNPDENDDTRATFIVSAELIRKIKYISLMEDCLQKDIVNEALSLYVTKWEEENGKIKMHKK